jgi:hypothetical protein
LYRLFVVNKQDPNPRLFSSAPFFVFSYATSQWAGSPFRPLVKVSDVQIGAGTEPDSNAAPDVELLKYLVLPMVQVCRVPPAHLARTTPVDLSRLPISYHQNSRPNASGKQRKFVKIDGFCSESAVLADSRSNAFEPLVR